jgi:hypothetical protein
MAQYGLYAVQVGGTHIPVTEASTDPQTNVLRQGGASTIDATVTALRSAAPTMTFSTPACKTAIDALGVVGYNVTSGSTVVLWYGNRSDSGGFSASADSVSVTINEGLITMGPAQVDRNGHVQMQWTVTVSYDGSNAPFAVDRAATAPSVTALGELYALHSAVLTYAGPTTQQIPLASGSVNPNTQVFSERGAGDIYPTFVAVQAHLPAMTVTTPAVATMLGHVGVESLKATSLVMYWGQLSDDGWAGSNDIAWTLDTPLICLDGINGQHNSTATARFTAYGEDDGAVCMTVSTTASAPAVTSLDEMYTGGPVSFGGDDYQSLGWSLNMNNRVQHGMTDGVVWPTYAKLSRRNVSAQARVLDVGQQDWEGATETDSVLYLREVSNRGSRTAEGTATHISFTLASGQVTPSQGGGQWGDHAVETITFLPVKDGANDVVAIDTTAAIS